MESNPGLESKDSKFRDFYSNLFSNVSCKGLYPTHICAFSQSTTFAKQMVVMNYFCQYFFCLNIKRNLKRYTTGGNIELKTKCFALPLTFKFLFPIFIS